jgi:hypothetical protein
MTKIVNWFVGWHTKKGNAYTPPELCLKALRGQVQGHAVHADGMEVCLVLSPLAVRIEGRIVHTPDEVFELGEPEPGYLKWLLETGIGYDETQPIKMVETLKHGTLQGKRPPGGGRGQRGENG